MLIAHITDLHVRPYGLPANRVAETNMLVARAIETVAALDPPAQAVFISGDLTDNGLPEEFAELMRLTRRLKVPVYVVPGNHDRRDEMKKACAAWPGVTDDPDFIQYTADIGPLRLIALDTVKPSSSAGELCARRLAFLEQALADAGTRPVVILMHHPPFRCGLEGMDAIRLHDGAEAFAALVARHPNVERILCGHTHRAIHVRLAGTVATTSPSVAVQVALDLTPGGGDDMVLEPPAFQLHLWIEGQGLVTHGAFIERFPGPFPFVLDPDYPGRS
jgi:3',5'-cyclic AMP phosphodiesterase CpdA